MPGQLLPCRGRRVESAGGTFLVIRTLRAEARHDLGDRVHQDL
jgi:hypothetical protein